jgi:hypothetical protein
MWKKKNKCKQETTIFSYLHDDAALFSLEMERSPSHSRILLLRAVPFPLCFAVAVAVTNADLFFSSAFFLLRLASAAATSAEPTGATASGEQEHTRPAPSSPSASFLSAGAGSVLCCRSNLALRLPLPLLAAAGFLYSAGRGAYNTSGAPTTPRRMTPHDAGGADPVLRRAAAGADVRLRRRGGWRGDGLGCA